MKLALSTNNMRPVLDRTLLMDYSYCQKKRKRGNVC